MKTAALKYGLPYFNPKSGSIKFVIFHHCKKAKKDFNPKSGSIKFGSKSKNYDVKIKFQSQKWFD